MPNKRSSRPPHRHASRAPAHDGEPPIMLYGRHPIAELLRARPDQIQELAFVRRIEAGPIDPAIMALRASAEAAQIPWQEIDKGRAERLAAGAPHQGVLAELRPFHYVELMPWVETLEGAPLLIALDHIQDPHNLGALARTALALGAHGIILPKDRSAQVTASAFKASAGALAHLPVTRVVNLARSLDKLAELGMQIVGTHLEAATAPDAVNWKLGTVLVIGNEQSGLRPSTAARCGHCVTIPIERIGSLNASVAGAICLYEAQRQRRSCYAVSP